MKAIKKEIKNFFNQNRTSYVGLSQNFLRGNIFDNNSCCTNTSCDLSNKEYNVIN